VETPADEKASVPSSPNVGLSALLIGTNGGRALRVIDSVTAIVSGILDANKALEDSKLIDKVCFDTLQIVELYETVAVQALWAQVGTIPKGIQVQSLRRSYISIVHHAERLRGGIIGRVWVHQM